MKKLQTKMQKYWLFSPNDTYLWKFQKTRGDKSKEDEQTLAELTSAHRRSQAKCQLVQPVTSNDLNCSCLPYNKHLNDRA